MQNIQPDVIDNEEFPAEEVWYPEKEMETVHLYWYAEPPQHPLSRQAKGTILVCVELVLLLFGIVTLCLIPNTPAWTVTTIAVPAHFIPRQWTVMVALVPTGIQHYPATYATGTLTIYNGSAFMQELPAHFLVTTSAGLEITTEQAVLIAPANSPILGTAIVASHALVSGTQGNIPAGAINQTYGNALYLKNLTAFAGGQEAYTKQYVTAGDQAKALEAARQQLRLKQLPGLLAHPCTEHTRQDNLDLWVTWACEYAIYQVPKQGRILSAHLSGNMVFLTIRSVEHLPVTHGVK